MSDINERDYWLERASRIRSLRPPKFEDMTTDQIKKRTLILEETFKDVFGEGEEN